MKRLFLIPAVAAMLAFAAAPVCALTITPATAIAWDTAEVQDLDALNEYLASLVPVESFSGSLLYKAEAAGEAGTFWDSYSTAFTPPGDWANAIITFDGGDFIACPTCWLVIKDGNHIPRFYFYNLDAWDGQETIEMTGFWDTTAGGSISHVSIWGDGQQGGGEDGSTIPEPAVLTMFGLGLALVASRLRKH